MFDKSKKISVEVSPGELLDKISILQIKIAKIKDKKGQKKIKKEYNILKSIKNIKIKRNNKIQALFREIKKVNLKLWNIEDEIRQYESKKDFGRVFIKLARSVYINNDKRAKLKSKINNLLRSNIKEVKSYTKY